MFCRYCGGENPADAVYCNNCGERLAEPGGRRKKIIRDMIRLCLILLGSIELFYGVNSIVQTIWKYCYLSTGSVNEFAEAYFRASPYLTILSDIVTIFILTVFFRLYNGSASESIGLRKTGPSRVISAFAVGASLQLPAGILIGLIPFSENLVRDHTESVSVSPGCIQIIAAVIAAPVVEEVIFRGIIYDRFKKTVGAPVGAIVSSLVFAAFHSDFITSVTAFVFSLFFCVLYSRRRSILVTVAAHMGFNASAYVVGYLNNTVLILSATFACLGILIAGLYILFRRDEVEYTEQMTR